jgi:hypothetical protein
MRRPRCWRAARAGRCRRRRRPHPDVALDTRVRAVGPQALNRIDDEGERLVVDVDRFDRLGAVFSSIAATARIGSPW